MAFRSGQNGKVLIGAVEVAQITSWNVTFSSVITSRASSATAGFKKTVSGVKSASGTINFILDETASNQPVVLIEGSDVALKLYIDAADFVDLPGTIESMTLDDIDIDDGSDVSGSASFVSDGAWTLPAAWTA